MKKELRWYDHFALNAYWLGQSFVSGVMTPILTPWLVLLSVRDGVLLVRKR